MAKVGTLWIILAQCVSSAVFMDISQVKVNPKQGSISGIFQASLSNSYAFNVSQAREVCQKLGVIIAEKQQVARALKKGFQTCRFGWVDEQIAVVPRIDANPACGKGGTGIVIWRQTTSMQFDVFCFNSTDFEAQEQLNTTPMYQTTSRMHQTSTAGVLLRLRKITRPTHVGSSLQPTSSSPSREESKNSPSIGVVPTALLIATIFTFLLAAVVAVWYFKMSRSCAGLWDSEQQKECIETKVWNKSVGKDAKEPQAKEENCSQENKSDVAMTVNSENESGSAA